jgi:segregation and condensation protein B
MIFETTDSPPGDGLEDGRLKSILESLLFAAGEPVSLAQLANALEEVPRERIRKALGEMAAAYASGERGFVLQEVAGGYQLRTPSQYAPYVRRLLSAKPSRLSRPLLETLAIVAYRQPVTRPEIEQLRGVDSGGVLDTLVERSLIRIAGRKDAPGRPIMYTTTPDFLELFGLKDLASLPDLEEFRELEGLRDAATPVGVASADSIQSATSESTPEVASAEQNTSGQPSSDLPGLMAHTGESSEEAEAANAAEDGSASPLETVKQKAILNSPEESEESN